MVLLVMCSDRIRIIQHKMSAHFAEYAVVYLCTLCLGCLGLSMIVERNPATLL